LIWEYGTHFVQAPQAPHGPMPYRTLQEHIHNGLDGLKQWSYWLESREHSAFYTTEMGNIIVSLETDNVPYLLTHSIFQLNETDHKDRKTTSKQRMYSLWLEIPYGIVWRIVTLELDKQYHKRSVYVEQPCDDMTRHELNFYESHGPITPWYEQVASIDPWADGEVLHMLMGISEIVTINSKCAYVKSRGRSKWLYQGPHFRFVIPSKHASAQIDMPRLINYRKRLGDLTVDQGIHSEYMDDHLGLFMGSVEWMQLLKTRLKQLDIDYFTRDRSQYHTVVALLPASSFTIQFLFMDYKHKGELLHDFPLPGCLDNDKPKIELYEMIIHGDKDDSEIAQELEVLYSKGKKKMVQPIVQECPDDNDQNHWQWNTFPCYEYIGTCYWIHDKRVTIKTTPEMPLMGA